MVRGSVCSGNNDSNVVSTAAVIVRLTEHLLHAGPTGLPLSEFTRVEDVGAESADEAGECGFTVPYSGSFGEGVKAGFGPLWSVLMPDFLLVICMGGG